MFTLPISPDLEYAKNNWQINRKTLSKQKRIIDETN
jgi:hypothetical protein